MTIFLVTIHILCSLLLILVVLLQQGKGADLQGAFGGGGSQTFFGARGATTVLHKATSILFVLFVFTSMGLAVLQSRPRKSLMRGTAGAAPVTAPASATTTAPAIPAPTTAAPAPAAVPVPAPSTTQ